MHSESFAAWLISDVVALTAAEVLLTAGVSSFSRPPSSPCELSFVSC